MPLCPQITNTPITVTLTGSFTVTNVVPVLAANTEQLAATDASVAAANAAAAAAVTAAAAAAVTAGAAQTTANTALANAATAYTAAIGSLQPSASTIVNASNQMTAIAANGVTVYSGSSASSGARVVLNSTGLAGFNSGGSATFSISASTGAAVFSGSVTGATITGSDLNIAGVFLVNGTTGVMTATSATITGVINATSGYFGTVANGFSISSTGLVGVGSGTIVGGAISGTVFTNGSTFSVSSTGVLTASSGTIGGFTLSSSSIYSSTNLVIETSGQISGGNSSTIFYGFANIGGGSVTGERLIVTGNSSFVGQTIATDNVTSQTHFYTPFASTTSSSANAFINTGSTPAGRLMRSTSSMRYKTDIQSQEINPFAILKLEPKSFYDKKEFEDNDDSTDGLKRYFGLIAEEVAAIPELANLLVSYDQEERPDSVNYDRISVALIPLLNNINKRLTNLEGA